MLVAGQPIGSVDDVTLTNDAQAEVTISVDRPLHEGTTAVIRSTSLSGIANRYVSIAPGPDSSPKLADGTTLNGDSTTTPVDLDQLFNTFRPSTRRGLQKIIQGSAAVYTGAGPQANASYRYFAPALDSTRRLFDELTSDQQAFTRFLTSSSSVLAAVASKRDELSALTQNANRALGAIASENSSLDRSLVALPPALRQASTTFVNLRAALDDLTPVVRTAKPATRDLAPFLRQLRPVAEESVPVFGDLAAALHRTGGANDLTDALNNLPAAEAGAARSSPQVVRALNASAPVIRFVRPYSPDLFAWLAKFGEATSYYDANGHYARVQPAGLNVFHLNGGTDTLDPISPAQQFSDYPGMGLGPFSRCPGAATQPVPGSNPFLDDGNLAGACNPSDVPPGP